MKKILLALSVLALCGCTAKEAENPIDAKNLSLKMDKEHTNFGLSIPNFEAMLNYRLADNYSDFVNSTFEETNGVYTFEFDDSIDIVATTDGELVNSIEFVAYTDENEENKGEELADITNIILGDFESGLADLSDKAIEVYNECAEKNEMHGSAVRDNLLCTISFIAYDDSSEFSVIYEPTKYTYNAEYQKSSDYRKFLQTYCPSFVSDEEQETQKAEEEPQEEPQQTYYGEGMYKVGVDIPAGEYNVQANAGEQGYIEVSADASGDSIITNDIFNNNTYISVSDGQFLTLKSCYIQQ